VVTLLRYPTIELLRLRDFLIRKSRSYRVSFGPGCLLPAFRLHKEHLGLIMLSRETFVQESREGMTALYYWVFFFSISLRDGAGDLCLALVPDITFFSGGLLVR